LNKTKGCLIANFATVPSSQLVRDNAEAIGQCAEAARTAGSDQQCTITVKAPAAPAQ